MEVGRLGAGLWNGPPPASNRESLGSISPIWAWDHLGKHEALAVGAASPIPLRRAASGPISVVHVLQLFFFGLVINICKSYLQPVRIFGYIFKLQLRLAVAAEHGSTLAADQGPVSLPDLRPCRTKRRLFTQV